MHHLCRLLSLVEVRCNMISRICDDGGMRKGNVSVSSRDGRLCGLCAGHGLLVLLGFISDEAC